MTRGRVSIAAVAGLILLAAAWYWGAPWWAVWRTGEAAPTGNADRLAEWVDFERLTQQAQEEHRVLWRWLATVTPPDSADRRAYIARAKRLVAVGYREVKVGPEDVRPWLAELPSDLACVAGLKSNERYPVYIERRGLNEFRIRDRDSPENGGILTFRRHGLSWRLEGMQWGQQ